MILFKEFINEMSYGTHEPYNKNNHSFKYDFDNHHKFKMKLITKLKPKFRLYNNLNNYFLTDEHDNYIAGVQGVISSMKDENNKDIKVLEIRQGHSIIRGHYIILLKSIIEFDLDVVLSDILLSNSDINFWKKVEKGGPFNLVSHLNKTKIITKYHNDIDYFNSEYRLGISKVPYLYEDTLKRIQGYSNEKIITYLYSNIGI